MLDQKKFIQVCALTAFQQLIEFSLLLPKGNSTTSKPCCPSGLRGSTQIRVYSYAWVQTPHKADRTNAS